MWSFWAGKIYSKHVKVNGRVVVFVLGAGRGPLVDATINAGRELLEGEETQNMPQTPSISVRINLN